MTSTTIQTTTIQCGSRRVHAHAMPADAVIDALVRRGFRVSERGDHVVAQRDAVRTVVPGRGRMIPAQVVRMVEFALEPQLGPDWITGRAPRAAVPRFGMRAEAGSRTVYMVDAVVVHHAPSDPWCAFLAEDFTVIGFGDEREDALRDLVAAAASLMDVDPADVALVTRPGR